MLVVDSVFPCVLLAPWNDMVGQTDGLRPDESMECVGGETVSLKCQMVASNAHSLKLLDAMPH